LFLVHIRLSRNITKQQKYVFPPPVWKASQNRHGEYCIIALNIHTESRSIWSN
jgi:hypothetical protein